VYVDPVAPPIGTQDAPEESHRSHWYANVGAGWPLHTPGDAVSVEPSTSVPEIEGGVVLTGAAVNGWTTPVADELTGPAEPPLFVAVTATTIVEPISAATSVYAEPVAPPIGEHELPELSQRSHW
jgi:hypothetical protein